MNKFFEVIKNLSYLFIVICGITIVCLVIYGGYSVMTYKSHNSVEVNVKNDASGKKTRSFRLGALQNIYGTKHHFVELLSEDRGLSRSYTKEIHNILYFRGDELEQDWLFPHHDSIILSLNQITYGDNENRTTHALFYEFIEKDTNGDNVLNRQDELSIAIATSSGDNFRVLDKNIKSIIGRIVDEKESVITVLMHQGQRVMLKKYSLDTFEKINEKELTNISKPS